MHVRPIGVILIAAMIWAGASEAQPRQVSNEPSTESFSGNSERNWSSISVQGAYASVLNGSGVSGYGIGANAAFIPRNRLGRGSLGLDLDAIVLFLSTKDGTSAGTDFLWGVGPIVKVFPNKFVSLSLTLRPGMSIASDGSSQSDFALAEALFLDVHPTPEFSVGLAPTISQVFASAEVFTLFHLAVMLSFAY